MIPTLNFKELDIVLKEAKKYNTCLPFLQFFSTRDINNCRGKNDYIYLEVLLEAGKIKRH